MVFKCSLDACTFMPWLLYYFDLPNYVSESRKIYTVTLLLMSMGRGFSSSFGWLKIKSFGGDIAWRDRGTGRKYDVLLMKSIFKVGSLNLLVQNLRLISLKRWNFEAWFILFTYISIIFEGVVSLSVFSKQLQKYKPGPKKWKKLLFCCIYLFIYLFICLFIYLFIGEWGWGGRRVNSKILQFWLSSSTGA